MNCGRKYIAIAAPSRLIPIIASRNDSSIRNHFVDVRIIRVDREGLGIDAVAAESIEGARGPSRRTRRSTGPK